MDGRLLLVIPPVAVRLDGALRLDLDFGNNLRAYLAAFAEVIVACPVLPVKPGSSFPALVPLEAIEGHPRARVIELPYPYREDRYYRALGSVRALLSAEIDAADYLLFSPHSAFDWSTCAARIAIEKGRSYDMEGDWDLQNVQWSQWRKLPWGFGKLRKWLWIAGHTPHYMRAMRGSSVALLQGRAVYEAYKNVAPNPHKVLNVQMTAADRVTAEALAAKRARIRSGAPLRISYAGRAIAMKGPLDWVDALAEIARRGVTFEATWYGEGDLADAARARIGEHGLADRVTFAGKVDRPVAMAAVRSSDIFLFCHQTEESPRCLVEALVCATPILGYDSLYARDLVERAGGGVFVSVGDWRGLAAEVWALDADRPALDRLVADAAKTAEGFDREAAMAERIALIRRYVTPPPRPRAH